MAVFVGNNEIDIPYILEDIQEIRVGSELVWQAGLPEGTTFNFEYIGAVQSVELPRGKYKLQCWGAQGGTSYASSSGEGSKGGYSEGVLTLTEKTTLYIFVGGQGSRGSSTSLVNGGWNGGGASVGFSSYDSDGIYGESYPACGGGATDISTVTSSMSYSSGRTDRSSASLLARCIVAGGGAGGSYRYTSEETTSETEVYTCTLSFTTTYVGSGFTDFIDEYPPLEAGKPYIFRISGSFPSGYTGAEFIVQVGSSSQWILMNSTYTFSGRVIMFRLRVNGGNFSGASVPTITVYEKATTTSTSTSSSYSNESQQGGGTSGKGQYPGTQNAGGNGNGDDGGFGYGGSQKTTGYRYCSGGGGGGWYGGGTAYSDSSTSYINYSGGGSGFVNTAANASYRPSGYTGLQLDSGTTTAGNSSFPSTSGGTETGHSGNGYARITVIE